MKRKSIASDSPLLVLKLTQDQFANVPLKRLKVLVENNASHGAKTISLYVVVRELLTFNYVESNRSPVGPLITKFCVNSCFKFMGRFKFIINFGSLVCLSILSKIEEGFLQLAGSITCLYFARKSIERRDYAVMCFRFCK